MKTFVTLIARGKLVMIILTIQEIPFSTPKISMGIGKLFWGAFVLISCMLGLLFPHGYQ